MRLAGSPLRLRLALTAGGLNGNGGVRGWVIADAQIVAFWDCDALRRVRVVVLSKLAVRRRLQVIRWSRRKKEQCCHAEVKTHPVSFLWSDNLVLIY